MGTVIRHCMHNLSHPPPYRCANNPHLSHSVSLIVSLYLFFLWPATPCPACSHPQLTLTTLGWTEWQACRMEFPAPKPCVHTVWHCCNFWPLQSPSKAVYIVKWTAAGFFLRCGGAGKQAKAVLISGWLVPNSVCWWFWVSYLSFTHDKSVCLPSTAMD